MNANIGGCDCAVGTCVARGFLVGVHNQQDVNLILFVQSFCRRKKAM